MQYFFDLIDSEFSTDIMQSLIMTEITKNSLRAVLSRL